MGKKDSMYNLGNINEERELLVSANSVTSFLFAYSSNNQNDTIYINFTYWGEHQVIYIVGSQRWKRIKISQGADCDTEHESFICKFQVNLETGGSKLSNFHNMI